MLKKGTLFINSNLMEPSSRNLNWNCLVSIHLSTFLVSKGIWDLLAATDTHFQLVDVFLSLHSLFFRFYT